MYEVKQFILQVSKQGVRFFERYGDEIVSGIFHFFLNIFIAGIILFVGFRIVGIISKGCKKALDKFNIEYEVKTFLLSFVKIGLKALVIIWAVTIIGVPNSSIIALFGTASVSIGLALQGGLSNITGGLIILLIKPFHIGDYIVFDSSSINCEGIVKEIDIFYTRISTADNKTIVVPNGLISNATLVNVTKQDTRRVDLVIGVSYSSDISYVKETIREIVLKEDLVFEDEEHKILIFVDNLSSSSVDIGVRFWVPTDDYWKIRWDVLENIKNVFQERNISIPYPQLDVHFDKKDSLQMYYNDSNINRR
ncbi:MAG: mechanosensitive ion channel family protein [Lachnospiraceae bacterium]